MHNNTKIEKNQELVKTIKKPKEKKMMMPDFIDFMEDKGVKMERFKECGNLIKFQTTEDKRKYLLSGGNFCKNRFCPFCSWLKAKKTAFELLELIKVVEHKENLAFLFIGLTAPNVKKDELRDEIDDFNKSFKRLFETKEFRAFNKGFIRKLEITYNRERDDYHPHFHLIVAVNKSYFTSRDYMSKRRLLELWQRAKRDNTITQVDIKPCKMDTVKSVMELATYSAKQNDLYLDKDVFDGFYQGLYRKKILVYNGIFKEYRQFLKNGDIKPDEVLELRELLEKTFYEVYLTWTNEDYQILEENILSEDRKKNIYNLEINIE